MKNITIHKFGIKNSGMDTPVTLAIVIITCIASFPAFSNEKLKDDLLFWPYYVKRKNQYYRFFTGGFLHADTLHLMFNMIALYSFGASLEKFLFPANFEPSASTILYIVLYLSAIIVACIPDYFKYKDQYEYRALGASGAVSAVVFAAIIINPNTKIGFIFLPGVGIPGYLFGILFLIFSAYLARRGQGNIGHNAHFWGGVYGIFFTWSAARAFANKDLFKEFIEQVF